MAVLIQLALAETTTGAPADQTPWECTANRVGGREPLRVRGIKFRPWWTSGSRTTERISVKQRAVKTPLAI